MSALFTPTRMRISVDRYQRMVAAGVLTKTDRIELIEGDMLDMAPIGIKHSAITSRLHELFVLAVSRSATVVGGRSSQFRRLLRTTTGPHAPQTPCGFL